MTYFNQLKEEFTPNVTFAGVLSSFNPVKMMHDLFPAQVYQLPSYRDKHFSPKPGPRPPGRAADTKPSLGGICSEGTGPAWRSQPTAGQEV